MSTNELWCGRKWSGSPKKLQKKVKKKASSKNVGWTVGDPNELINCILFGWYFDCVCGAKGEDYDDGYRSLQCDVCKRWMHNHCNGVPTSHDDLLTFFHRKRIWVCPSCKRGDYKFKGKHWSATEETNERSVVVKFTLPKPDIDISISEENAGVTIREQRLSMNENPMLRRRNARCDSTLRAWLRRRNADCSSSLTEFLKFQECDGNDLDSLPISSVDNFTY